MMVINWSNIRYRLKEEISTKVPIAPFVIFRLWFGLMMIFTVVRFAFNGWIRQLYIEPSYYFTYYGLGWIQPFSDYIMYGVFVLLAVSAIGIFLGYKYRLSTVLFFLLFTYVELIDKTNYLNHYYFISLVSFLMIFLPCAREFSLDALTKGSLNEVSKFYLYLIRVQVGLVYFFAGLAKVNFSWLIQALPLKMWLGALVHKPLIGWLFKFKLTAYIFSWMGMLFDLTVPFFLSIQRTRHVAYFTLILFHLMTWYLFPIGVFPWLMMGSALIFFPISFHDNLLLRLKKLFRFTYSKADENLTNNPKWTIYFLSFFLLVQVSLPFRHTLYEGNTFWTEQGYRFSWRVMLMEKAGYVQFLVRDLKSDQFIWVSPYEYLTPQQEKMMATQPDMILQFAHFLRDTYAEILGSRPAVYAEAYVSLNGSKSKPFINRSVNLSEIKRGWHHKPWILDD